MNAIQFVEVGKRYGSQQVLQSFSASLPLHQPAALMGPSGQGKTTLARLLLGLEKPDEGEIRGAEGLRFGCVFQEDRLCAGLSAVGNVALVLQKPDGEAIRGALRELGLGEEDLEKPAHALSGGQRRRVALARALLAPGDYLVLDEAFKGLDEVTRERAFRFACARRGNRGLLLITHDEREAAAFGGVRISL